MTTLKFEKDSDASDFACKLLETQETTQICYEYARCCEVEFWWLYKTDMCCFDERARENLEKIEVIDSLYSYLDSNNIEYGCSF